MIVVVITMMMMMVLVVFFCRTINSSNDLHLFKAAATSLTRSLSWPKVISFTWGRKNWSGRSKVQRQQYPGCSKSLSSMIQGNCRVVRMSARSKNSEICFPMRYRGTIIFSQTWADSRHSWVLPQGTTQATWGAKYFHFHRYGLFKIQIRAIEAGI